MRRNRDLASVDILHRDFILKLHSMLQPDLTSIRYDRLCEAVGVTPSRAFRIKIDWIKAGLIKNDQSNHVWLTDDGISAVRIYQQEQQMTTETAYKANADLRQRFLQTIYDASEGSTFKLVGKDVVLRDLGLDLDKAYPIGKYLHDKGLVEIKGSDGFWTITSRGIDAIENPHSVLTDAALPHTVYTINAQGANIGALQQNSHHSTQNVHYSSADLGVIKEKTSELLEHLNGIGETGVAVDQLKHNLQILHLTAEAPAPQESMIAMAADALKKTMIDKAVDLAVTLGQPHFLLLMQSLFLALHVSIPFSS